MQKTIAGRLRRTCAQYVQDLPLTRQDTKPYADLPVILPTVPRETGLVREGGYLYSYRFVMY